MSLRLFQNKAQSTLEYAILIGVIVAALLAMQVYLKRGYQGKMKDSADSMGSQFSPGQTTATYNTHSFTNSQEVVESANRTTTTHIRQQTSNRTATENLATFNDEHWWDWRP